VLRTLAGPFAGANLMPWRKLCLPLQSAQVSGAASYGYAAYWLGGEFERLQGRMVVPLMLIAGTALIAGGLFVRRREAQLIIEAEHAIPGSLEPH
jgi:membrane protein DedA with SNARE-associated domain